jgi:23S rRNA pseudouridine1911/1915/1917 synthase
MTTTSADLLEDLGDEKDDQAGSDDLFEAHKIIADKGQSPIRLDRFLTDRLPKVSRNKVQNAIRFGSVLVDNQAVKPNHKLRPGEEISVILPRSSEEDYSVLPQDIPLNIVYEDDDVMVINKPANFAVHPGVGIPNGTLVNAVAWHLKHSPPPTMPGNDESRAGIVHRIDKDTTGLMIVAKNEFSMAHLANQFFHHTIERKYVALVWGDPESEGGTITGNIGRNPNDRKVFMVFPEGEEGKHAVTHYKVLERFYYVSLVECQLETGRTHQIRVHMKYIGHTLFGDKRYGGNTVLRGTVFSKYKTFVEHNLQTLPRQGLHAKIIGFTHPRTGEKMRFESEIPDDMQAVMERWRIYVKSRKELL